MQKMIYAAYVHPAHTVVSGSTGDRNIFGGRECTMDFVRRGVR